MIAKMEAGQKEDQTLETTKYNTYVHLMSFESPHGSTIRVSPLASLKDDDGDAAPSLQQVATRPVLIFDWL